jgi:predicted membrane protein DUF2079
MRRAGFAVVAAVAVVAGFGGFAAVTGTASLLRWATYHSRSLDMAYYVRIVWGLAHGRIDNPVVGADNLLGLHLEPVLLPLAGLVRLGVPTAPLLLVVQALGAAAAIFPAWSLARRRLAPLVGDAWALAAALCALLLPTVSRCVDYDFHPSTFAIWPMLAFVDALDAGARRRALGWFALALACREDVGLQLGCVTATFCWSGRRARAGSGGGSVTGRAPSPGGGGPSLAGRAPSPGGGGGGWDPYHVVLTVVGFAWFFGYAFAIQPRWLPDAATGSYGAHFAPFAGGAGGVPGVLAAALREPVRLLGYLASGDRPGYALLLLLQVAFLPLLAPRYLAGALPIYVINLLSDFPRVRTLQAHYATAMAPFLAAAAILGAARLASWIRPRRWRFVPAAALLGASAAAFWFRGLSPGAPEFSLASYRPDAYARRAAALVAAAPPAAAVVAPQRILPHLAERASATVPRYQRAPAPFVLDEDGATGLPYRRP